MTRFPRELVVSETYQMTDEDGTRYEWDVSLGRRLAQERGADVLPFCPAEHAITPEHLRERYPDLDEAYANALSAADLARPLLFVPFQGRHLLVDGWHRLFRAVTAGVPELPAYLLTETEADAILRQRTAPSPPSPRRREKRPG